jgi:hypothetical protein
MSHYDKYYDAEERKLVIKRSVRKMEEVDSIKTIIQEHTDNDVELKTKLIDALAEYNISQSYDEHKCLKTLLLEIVKELHEKK